MELRSVLSDLFFPQLCLLCGESLLLNRAPSPWTRLSLCGECIGRLIPLEGNRCRICSLPLISEIELCMRCRERDFAFESNRAVYAYRDPVKELVSHYKFHNQRNLSLLFSSRIADTLSERLPGIPVVPVPSRPTVVRKRGWDHVGVIAESLRKRHRIEVIRLLRRDNGMSQKSLDFTHRLTNLHGRIHWSPRPRYGLAVPNEVVLLDDVFTTGATASECSRILKDHGVARVFVVTIAVD